MELEKIPRLDPMQSFVLNKYMINYEKVEGFEQHFEKAVRKLKKIVNFCSDLDKIDIYYSPSMRTLEDFVRAERVCKDFEMRGKSVYSPVNTSEMSREKKYDLENRMMNISKCIVIDGTGIDTGGKFINAGYFRFKLKKSVFMLAESEKQYKLYHDLHPMAMILGMHVAKTIGLLSNCINSEFERNRFYHDEKIDENHNMICPICDSVIKREERRYDF